MLRMTEQLGLTTSIVGATFPAAIEFLSATTSAGSLGVLERQCLLTEVRWSRSDLIAWFALISARTFYSYAP
ncbi:hypothetical protein M747DRAFT_170176 [Aspergillus niger ATCC 13496]|uniref:Uncharacterized protein n=1 Tax=Aspergillus niger ATCC 13496 TaxID=1353008 RepID=A0A370BLD9_ASPNG|nr:hypothetical protein M747DRAFT_170176 [Aspergillus niger ATCC 13496]